MKCQERPELSRSDELVENGAFRRIGRSTPVDLVDAEPAKVLKKKSLHTPKNRLLYVEWVDCGCGARYGRSWGPRAGRYRLKKSLIEALWRLLRTRAAFGAPLA